MGVKQYKFVFRDRKQAAEGTTEVTFDSPGRDFTFQAGQYVRLTIPELPDSVERGNTRDFTVASSPNTKGLLTIAFRNSDSPFKQALNRAKAGMELLAQGPLGVFTLPEDRSLPLIFLAGGIGITPFLSMARFAYENKLPYKIHLVFANTTEERAVYLPELLDMASKNKNFTLIPKTGPLNVEFIKKHIPANNKALWYICGVPQMVETLSADLSNKLDVPAENIITEEYVGYNTGNRDYRVMKMLPKNITGSTALDIGLDKKVLEAMLQAAGQAALVSLTDAQGSIFYVNQKFIDVSKYSREELLGQNHRILKSAYHTPKFFEEMWKTISNGKLWRGEIINRAKDGTFYWVDASISPVLDAKGKIKSYVAVRILITEKKEIEQAKRATLNLLEDLEIEKERLAETNAKDEAMLAGIGDGVVAIGLDQKILVMNQAAKEILHCEGSEVLGKPYTDFFYATDKDGVTIPDSALVNLEAFKSGSIIKTDSLYYVAKNGGIKFPVALTIAPIKLQKKIVGVIDVFRDITREKAVDRAKTEFVSLASHQLRTPLTAISWCTEMLLVDYSEGLNDNQKKYLGEVHKGSKRMVTMVNTFLNVSRLELGTFAIKPEPTDVVKLARNVIAELKFQFEQKKLKFNAHLEEGIPLLNADPNLLIMILQNLLSNSIKYTAEEGIVSLGLRVVKRGEQVDKRQADQDGIVIVVSDTGYGIPKTQQDKIFTKLFRADNVRDKDTDGTGLGLYVIKTIVENSAGKTWFESEENKGSVFYVMLPLTRAEKQLRFLAAS